MYMSLPLSVTWIFFLTSVIPVIHPRCLICCCSPAGPAPFPRRLNVLSMLWCIISTIPHMESKPIMLSLSKITKYPILVLPPIGDNTMSLDWISLGSIRRLFGHRSHTSSDREDASVPSYCMCQCAIKKSVLISVKPSL